MNKFSISAPLLSICLLSSCSIFKSGSEDPSKIVKTENVKKNTAPTQQGIATDTAPDMNEPIDSTISNINSNKTRTIPGFIEPDVTQLPDNKDLQESNNVAPASSPLKPNSDNSITPLPVEPAASLPENP